MRKNIEALINKTRTIVVGLFKTKTTIEALRTLSTRVETLRHLHTVMHEVPEQQKQYATMLEDAYTALAQVETKGDELVQELEYHHARLGKAVASEGEGR